MGNKILLFTYGTMRRGFYNNGRLGDSKFLGAAVTCEPFVLHGRKFPRQIPYMSRVDSDHVFHGYETPVVGDLYLISPAMLYRVDIAEGHPHFYYRKTIAVRNRFGAIVEAEAYLIDVGNEQTDLIPDGNFKSYYSSELHRKQRHSRSAFWHEYISV
jgi:gamma-glutamylcyclotransferase (GGCT)/AIG2-like uncharacterized protein YtfP